MVTLHMPLVPVMVILFLKPSGSHLDEDIVILAGFVVLVVLTFARQILLGLDYRKNYHEMEELTASLQDRVRVQQMRNLRSGRPLEGQTPEPSEAAPTR
jgi:hypothetical protein